MNLDSNTTDSVPSRFKESNFRRFEPIIIQFLERWPQKSVFKPTTLSVETFSARLRDAVTAFLQPDNLWDSPIDKNKLRNMWAKKHVKQVGSTVVVCVASSNRKHTGVVYETTADGQTVKELVLDKCMIEHLYAMALLLNDGKLDVPCRVINSNLNESDFVLLQERFPNIQYTQVPDGFMLL